MTLSASQLAALKADIIAASDQACVDLEADPTNADKAFAVKDLYNLLASPDSFVWQTTAPVRDVFDAITWANYTPQDAVPASGDAIHVFNARMLVIQTKQMNLQNMLVGRVTLDASKANIRAGLRDAVINLPAGTNGASVTAGGASGATVMNALTRKATRVEKLLITSSPSTGGVTAGVMGFEGLLTPDDVLAAMAS